MYDQSESDAADRGARFNLPVLGTLERRWDTYQPFLKVIGIYHTLEDPNKVGYRVEEPPPKSTFGSVVADPSASDGLDDRGWDCPLGEPCTWIGPV
ncbi:hypothetical protein ACFCXF_26925 [Streptomyces virginiae]|uniref:hypothetical protein n=1 Tax=Streptomyces virginiae TaxID=1961 RepID=UPI0005264B0E|nr:hypothetical protein [Streptomyces virginiae]